MSLGIKELTLWSSDAMWRRRSGSTLARIMVCCLTALSHYLNQWWLLTSEVLWHSPERSFTANTQATVLCNKFENYTFKIPFLFLRANELKTPKNLILTLYCQTFLSYFCCQFVAWCCQIHWMGHPQHPNLKMDMHGWIDGKTLINK